MNSKVITFLAIVIALSLLVSIVFAQELPVEEQTQPVEFEQSVEIGNTIQPAHILGIRGYTNSENEGFILFDLGNGLDDTPRIVVALSHHPTIEYPTVTLAAPDLQLPSENEWKAASQFAGSMWLYVASRRDQTVLGPIDGAYTDWFVLYEDVMEIMHENNMQLPIIFMPVIGK